MKTSYIPKSKGSIRNRRVNPDIWITGPDLMRREKYYAFLKHRCQCRYRGEDYQLTFEDWENFWPDDVYLRRGRSIDSLLLTRYDISEGWSVENCLIQDRKTHLARKKEFLDAKSRV